MMLAALVLLCLVGYSDALSCRGCEHVACLAVAPPCKPSEYVYKPCGCCPLCPLEIGQPCGSFTQRCQFGLWCLKKNGNKLAAYKYPPWHLFFKGVCAKVDVCTS